MKTDLDYDELRRFEENLPNKSLWHVIATNPKINSFSHCNFYYFFFYSF